MRDLIKLSARLVLATEPWLPLHNEPHPSG